MYYTLAKEEPGCSSPMKIYLRSGLEGVDPPSIPLDHSISQCHRAPSPLSSKAPWWGGRAWQAPGQAALPG